MLILVDTREQKAFFRVGIKRCTLNVGDYTTERLLNKFHIERKSLGDLYGTLIHNHPRFRREIIRARDRRTKLIMVVEGTHSDFINKRFPRGEQRKTPSTTLAKIIATIKRRYKIEIVFCKDRPTAIKKTLARLKQEEKFLR